MSKRNNNAKWSEEILEKLTDEQDGIIIGGLLGDNHLHKRGESYRLKVEHSIKQEEYVNWMYKKLASLCTTTQPPTKKTRTTNNYVTIEFYTSSGVWLKKYHKMFYKEKVDEKGKIKYVKTITQELIEELPMHPMVLAVLFMDDGSPRSDCYSGRIATQGFEKSECDLLCKYFQKWNITVQVVSHLTKKEQFSITIPAKSFGTFANIIEPILKEIPSMQYKLNEDRKASSKINKK